MMPETVTTIVRSKTAGLAGRLAGVIAAIADTIAGAVRDAAIGIGPAPALQPIPVRARRGHALQGR